MHISPINSISQAKQITKSGKQQSALNQHVSFGTVIVPNPENVSDWKKLCELAYYTGDEMGAKIVNSYTVQLSHKRDGEWFEYYGYDALSRITELARKKSHNKTPFVLPEEIKNYISLLNKSIIKKDCTGTLKNLKVSLNQLGIFIGEK